MDYRVRGFTRDTNGHKLFIDHAIHSIQDFIDARTRARYQRRDANIQRANLFHTRMRIETFDLDAGVFKADSKRLSHVEQREIARRIEMEIAEIFSGGR